MTDIEVVAEGEFACFTRPEMKAERVSYRVMTPSAANGLLKSIYWKPQMEWAVREIALLKPIKPISLRRNEIGERQTEQRARRWGRDGKGGFFASDRASRLQRHTLALRDVGYLIRADAVAPDGVSALEERAKHIAQFRRRLARGQCYMQPYLGCREFPAWFRPPDDRDRIEDVTEQLGRMLHSLRYASPGGPGEPRFFTAELRNGVLSVPAAPPSGEDA